MTIILVCYGGHFQLLLIPFFVSMATTAKFVQPIPIFLAYLVPLDVDVTGNITAKN
jgi:hypothetical protein